MSNEEATRPQENQQQPAAEQESVAQGADQAATEAQAEEALAAPSVESLMEEVATLQAQVKDQSDNVLRAQAEVQNIRRRSERDVENAHKFALDKFSADLLPIIDSLERALDAAGGQDDDTVKSMREGIELTLRMFVDTLGKHGIEQINPVGEPFNPEFHQAMSMVPNPEMEPNSVMAVMQKGYVLKGRLVRPAMVVVSKAP